MDAVDEVVVVGAGIAGIGAASGMRAAGFEGRIVVVGDEPELPYRRPPVSKEILRGDKTLDQIRIKQQSWYDGRRIELLTGTRVSRIDPVAREVRLGDDTPLPYDRLVLATGGRARRLGEPSDKVHTLRSAADVPPLREALSAAGRLVVVGAGLIGSEIAASARTMDCEVTLLETAALPLPRLLPPVLGQMYVDLHKEHGVDLCTGVSVVGVEDRADGVVVAAADGRSWSAPVVVVAVGMEPRVELAAAAGVELGEGILVDGSGRTSAPSVYAAGDVANRPEPVLGGRCRVEHWQGAQNHGTAVGRAVAGEDVHFAEVPWCWSDQYAYNLQVTGWPEAADSHVVRGSLAERDFTAFFTRETRLVGAVTIGRPSDVRATRALVAERSRVRLEALADESVPVADSLVP